MVYLYIHTEIFMGGINNGRKRNKYKGISTSRMEWKILNFNCFLRNKP